MSNDRSSLRRTRRELLRWTLAAPVTLALSASAWRLLADAPLMARALGQTLQATPACPDADDETPAQTEGPFFKPRSPRRTSLREQGITGTPLVLAGQVLTRSCRPVAGALLDFWHADDKGVYDNAGFRLRGHQFADDAGRYRLETIVPGVYTGRTRHIHVKVQAPNGPVLTTQLYFPGEPRNQTDGIFNAKLLMAVRDGAGGRLATFTFVLDVR